MSPTSNRIWSGPLIATWLCLFAPVANAGEVSAQLRPIELMDWAAFDEPLGSVFVGVAGYDGQRASLLGLEGRLVEFGLVGASVRSGRVVMSVRGSAYRIFETAGSFAGAVSTGNQEVGSRRTDHGDYLVSTAVRLTSGGGPWDAAFRFGVRLPTTNPRVGLERNQTDFFTTVAGRHNRGPLAIELEVGGAINGVAGQGSKQTDPVLYGAGISYLRGFWEPFVQLHGRYDTRSSGAPRGNENQRELHVGVRSQGRTWLRGDLVRGLTDFSPAFGVEIRIGRSF